MARNRASMREGPLAELFRATEKAQRGEQPPEAEPAEPQPHADEEPSRVVVESAAPAWAAPG